MGVHVCVSMCVCVCVYTGIAWNELICGDAKVVHASSSFHPQTHTQGLLHSHTGIVCHTYTHAGVVCHTHTPFEDCEPTGLNVNIDPFLSIRGGKLAVTV